MSTVEQPATKGDGFVGRAMKRKEDPRMVTGRGEYVDDLALPGMVWAALVRSPEAHAKIVSIDKSAAEERPDVVGVFTHEDLKGEFAAPMPMVGGPAGVEVNTPQHWPLATGEVKHVGDPVAIVLGLDRYGVVDAAEGVIVEYEPLPVVVDPEAALRDGSPLVWEQFGTNKTHDWSIAGGDVEAAFADADVVVKQRIVNHRTAGAPIETRGCIADPRGDRVTLYSATQIPHIARFVLSLVTGMPEDKLRVVAPDVGGAFGSKINVFGEEVLAVLLARRLGRPVKWIETRSENMAVVHHGRDVIDYVELAAKRDGTVTGLRLRVVADLGAYFMQLTPWIPKLGFPVANGCYRIPNIELKFECVFTNKNPTDAIRGAGRPEMTHVLELGMNKVAEELGMDPLEVRRRNFVPKEEFPFTTALDITYDSGDYHGTLDKLLQNFDLDAFRREQAELRERGVYRGVGFSTYVEICGLGPSRALGPEGWGMQGGYFESALVRVHPTGSATVFTGASPHGQGHETGFAQIAADRLGVDPEIVDVIHGDTNTGPFGKNTYGSRSLAVGGEAVARAAEKVQDKARRIVAHKMEAAPEDIELSDGKFQVRGSPEKSMTLADVAGEAYIPADLPEGMKAGLDEICFYDPSNFVWPFGAHACISEVDVETGRVDVVRYVCVDDCGPAINPLLIDGQIHGGIVHALGQVLYEQVVYDADGQLVTGTFVDYALPSAADVPSFETDRTETPTPTNTPGVKGVGEAGTIAASPAIVNAV